MQGYISEDQLFADSQRVEIDRKRLTGTNCNGCSTPAELQLASRSAGARTDAHDCRRNSLPKIYSLQCQATMQTMEARSNAS